MGGRTLGDEIAADVAPYLPRALVSRAAREALCATLQIVPADVSRIFGFECRLGSEDDQTDVFMRISPALGGRDALARHTPPVPAERPGARPTWQQLADFGAEWGEPGTALETDVHQAWLEFDIPTGGPTPSLPGILFLHPRFAASSPNESVQRHVALTAAAARVTGAPLADPVEQRLGAVLAEIPPQAAVFCIGLMVGRPSTALRLCMSGFGPGDHVPFLQRVGFPGAAELRAVLDDLAPVADVVNLDLDVGGSIGARAHLEVRCDEERAPGAAERWRRLMDHLVGRGLVLAPKAEAFLAWPGLPLDQLDRPGQRGVFLRKLSHVKVAWEHGAIIDVKGYFGVWECIWRWDSGGSPLAPQ